MTQTEILALYDRYHDMVYRLALAATRSPQDAEDVVQNVFLKLLNGKNAPMAGKERPWLIKVTVNACRDLTRSFWWRKREPLDETIPFSAPEESGSGGFRSLLAAGGHGKYKAQRQQGTDQFLHIRFPPKFVFYNNDTPK